MTTCLLEKPVSRERKSRPKPSAEAARDRIDLRAESAWVARVERQAERFGVTVSAYIRRAVTKELELDEASESPRE